MKLEVIPKKWLKPIKKMNLKLEISSNGILTRELSTIISTIQKEIVNALKACQNSKTNQVESTMKFSNKVCNISFNTHIGILLVHVCAGRSVVPTLSMPRMLSISSPPVWYGTPSTEQYKPVQWTMPSIWKIKQNHIPWVPKDSAFSLFYCLTYDPSGGKIMKKINSKQDSIANFVLIFLSRFLKFTFEPNKTSAHIP